MVNVCEYALKNQLICLTNNQCLILHHEAFRADYFSRTTKIRAPSAALNLVLRELPSLTQVSRMQSTVPFYKFSSLMP